MIKIHRDPVESSVIATMGYDPLAKILDIEFKDDGRVYRYFDVPASEYDAFMEAPSKGTYLNREFKKAGYLYEIIDQVKRRRTG
ncbi:MAG TPA: KTSC domain-containing protein [Terriglobales bacterium]|nr:KTSC domain-containing protein [Terriglobales bacterium]